MIGNQAPVAVQIIRTYPRLSRLLIQPFSWNALQPIAICRKMGGNTKRRHYALRYSTMDDLLQINFHVFPGWFCVDNALLKSRSKQNTNTLAGFSSMDPTWPSHAWRSCFALWPRRDNHDDDNKSGDKMGPNWCRGGEILAGRLEIFCCVMVQNPLLNFSEIDSFSILMSNISFSYFFF